MRRSSGTATPCVSPRMRDGSVVQLERHSDRSLELGSGRFRCDGRIVLSRPSSAVRHCGNHGRRGHGATREWTRQEAWCRRSPHRLSPREVKFSRRRPEPISCKCRCRYPATPSRLAPTVFEDLHAGVAGEALRHPGARGHSPAEDLIALSHRTDSRRALIPAEFLRASSRAFGKVTGGERELQAFVHGGLIGESQLDWIHLQLDRQSRPWRTRARRGLELRQDRASMWAFRHFVGARADVTRKFGTLYRWA
jgi:hypothetical protein